MSKLEGGLSRVADIGEWLARRTVKSLLARTLHVQFFSVLPFPARRCGLRTKSRRTVNMSVLSGGLSLFGSLCFARRTHGCRFSVGRGAGGGGAQTAKKAKHEEQIRTCEREMEVTLSRDAARLMGTLKDMMDLATSEDGISIGLSHAHDHMASTLQMVCNLNDNC